MKIKDGAANPFARDLQTEEQERFVLVENAWDEDLEWGARSRYSDAPGASKRMDYSWHPGEVKRMEENYAKVVFGDWAIPKDDEYVRKWTAQMQKQSTKWPSNAPPHMLIYEELEDGKKGALLYDTHAAWMEWLDKFGRVELPRYSTSKRAGTEPPPMPKELVEMDKTQLMAFAESIKFPVPESWSANDMREILFQYAPKHMLMGAIKEANEMAAASAASSKSKRKDD